MTGASGFTELLEGLNMKAKEKERQTESRVMELSIVASTVASILVKRSVSLAGGGGGNESHYCRSGLSFMAQTGLDGASNIVSICRQT